MLIQHIFSIPETLGCYSPKFTKLALSKYSPLSLPYYKMKARSGDRWGSEGTIQVWHISLAGQLPSGGCIILQVSGPTPSPRLLPGPEKLGTAHWVLVMSLYVGLNQSQPVSREKLGKSHREAHSRRQVLGSMEKGSMSVPGAWLSEATTLNHRAKRLVRRRQVPGGWETSLLPSSSPPRQAPIQLPPG